MGCEVVGRYETLDGRVRHAARLLRPWSPPVNLLGTVSLRQTTLELWPVVGAVPSLTSEITIPSFIVVLKLLTHFSIVHDFKWLLQTSWKEYVSECMQVSSMSM